MNSNMAQKYIHYFGNESSESLLEAYGIVTKNNVPIDTLNPKICPNCNEGNTVDNKFCSKCKMIMSFEGYQEALESAEAKGRRIKVNAVPAQYGSVNAREVDYRFVKDYRSTTIQYSGRIFVIFRCVKGNSFITITATTTRITTNQQQ